MHFSSYKRAMNARYAHNGNARIYVNKKHSTYEKTGIWNVSRIQDFVFHFHFPLENEFIPVTPLLSSETYPEEHLENRKISQRNTQEELDPHRKQESWRDRDASMRAWTQHRPSELMNSFALCTLQPTRIDSISFWSVSSGAILGQPSELPSRNDSRSTIRAGVFVYTRGDVHRKHWAGPCPFVTVSMHFGGRASLQLSHGLTSAHLHSRAHIYISRHDHPWLVFS